MRNLLLLSLCTFFFVQAMAQSRWQHAVEFSIIRPNQDNNTSYDYQDLSIEGTSYAYENETKHRYAPSFGIGYRASLPLGKRWMLQTGIGYQLEQHLTYSKEYSSITNRAVITSEIDNRKNLLRVNHFINLPISWRYHLGKGQGQFTPFLDLGVNVAYQFIGFQNTLSTQYQTGTDKTQSSNSFNIKDLTDNFPISKYRSNYSLFMSAGIRSKAGSTLAIRSEYTMDAPSLSNDYFDRIDILSSFYPFFPDFSLASNQNFKSRFNWALSYTFML